ncbi:expressed unknown protein [Seminavis robusta]|uniref:Uncharacterized protein n=1 Tax=Seminavis robusta TaxID=568900 RepID=A0A9N8DDK9_9STRA|nr:expressed unknown protein [Seminavis robusta]|eukprot:Sro105_g053200.1 n/a (411) ;mRNA; r:42615-43847
MTSRSCPLTKTPPGSRRGVQITVLLGLVLLVVLVPQNGGVPPGNTTKPKDVASRNNNISDSSIRNGEVITQANTAVLPSPESKQASDTPSTSGKQPRITISLVTSFWAQSPEQPVSPHRREIEEAILNNINNPHLDQVAIILDGSSSDANCNHFKERMDQLNVQFHKQLKQHNITVVDTGSIANKKRPTLTCVSRNDKQPNYYQMFLYATSPKVVAGDVVIVANADQAFDSSVQEARRLRENAVLLVPTSGFNKDLVPSPAHEHFLFLHGHTSQNYTEGVKARCRPRMLSWDAFVFHRTLLEGKLVRSRDFMRNTVEGTQDFFRMNEEGAENAAYWALWSHVQNAGYFKTCDVVQMWHFHGFEKMHAHLPNEMYWDSPTGKVPEPWRKPTIMQRGETPEGFLNRFVISNQ